jgi:hypothetical protein
MHLALDPMFTLLMLSIEVSLAGVAILGVYLGVSKWIR